MKVHLGRHHTIDMEGHGMWPVSQFRASVWWGTELGRLRVIPWTTPSRFFIKEEKVSGQEKTKMEKVGKPAFILGGLVVALLLCWALVSGAPNQEACTMFTGMLNEIEPADVLVVYVGRLPESQRERIYVGDLSGQNPLFVEAWELRKKQVELKKQFEALNADHERKRADREEQFEEQRRGVHLKQRELDVEAESIRMAYEGGYSPLTRNEVRAKLIEIDIKKTKMELELGKQEQRIHAQNASNIEALIPQIEALGDKLTPIYEQLIEKSRELLEREKGQVCRWFGKWR